MPSCPSCGSSRLRGGYRTPHILLRLFGIRELLCNDCNYLYRAFSPIPPRPSRKHQSSRKDATITKEGSGARDLNPQVPPRPRPPPPPQPATPKPATLKPDPPEPGEKKQTVPQSRTSAPPRLCPYCGSFDTRRRHRLLRERIFLSFSDKRPFRCNGCDETFYAMPRRPE